MTTPKNPQIVALNTVGQSVWYDNLSRDVLRSGELASLIAQGVSGLTSNPTIFKQAIADTSNYDEEMRSPTLARLSTEDLCEALMVQDVAAAADLLRPTYENSEGRDGYASIEVSPFLADDCAGTVAAAKRLWSTLNRPNIMIKIPATPACIPAIQETLEAGINVNVTLIFSREVYEKVATAYVDAVTARVTRGEDVSRLASVASFFVSRVDAIVEKSFDALVAKGTCQESQKESFFGKVGVANSKVAYSSFLSLFGGERFAQLKKKGAQVQRPLWASTGTKNPVFKAVMYVEELAGPDTVNTMPPATLKALLAGGVIENRLVQGLDNAGTMLMHLNSMGISTDTLFGELQVAGVKSFADSYRDLLSAIEEKRHRV